MAVTRGFRPLLPAPVGEGLPRVWPAGFRQPVLWPGRRDPPVLCEIRRGQACALQGRTGEGGGAFKAVRARLPGRVYRDLAHRVLLPLLWEGPVAGGYALLFPWTEAICMGKQYPSQERFLALPLGTKLGIYREALAFHSHVAKRGYVSVDFYDGCVLFEEATGRTLLSSATWTPTTGCPSSTP